MLRSLFLLAPRSFMRTVIKSTYCSAAKPLTSEATPTSTSEAPPTVKPMTFRIRRTQRDGLPVYLEYRSQRARVFTKIKKIEGNVHDLHKDIVDYCNDPDLLSFVDELKGQITLYGDYKFKVIKAIRQNGY